MGTFTQVTQADDCFDLGVKFIWSHFGANGLCYTAAIEARFVRLVQGQYVVLRTVSRSVVCLILTRYLVLVVGSGICDVHYILYHAVYSGTSTSGLRLIDSNTLGMRRNSDCAAGILPNNTYTTVIYLLT